MYFTNDEHEQNFERLMEHYNRYLGQDPQYEANFYIASVPEIFDCLPSDLDEVEGNPLFYLMEFNEEKEIHVPAARGLTGSTNRMVEFGFSLFNGHPVSLDDVLGSVASEHLFNALIQAIKIRARKS